MSDDWDRAKLPHEKPSFSIDFDGTHGEYFGVIVYSDHGFVYEQQCAGLVCDQRRAQGFYFPVGGYSPKLDQRLDWRFLTPVFHRHGGCGGVPFSEQGFAELAEAVSCIRLEARELELDTSHPDEIVEAWVPVHTQFGAGVLVFPNCD